MAKSTSTSESTTSTATPKEAKRVVSLNDIKFNKENAILAAVACIPGIAIILFFVEKKDLFVRYHAAQYALLSLLYLIVWIPIIGWILPLLILVATIVGAIKAYKGERFDLPLASGWAISLMNRF
ncbi:hypothetical protein M0R04_00430 [Candidatus Dojkabacteria bacterium]|jgi:uncharacterized membrane protein|nr:hypothetical protein [Candidatus Dojkabacteria bacterium]